MGCDIHMYIEYSREPENKNKERYWTNFGSGFNPGRNYELFSALSEGVRGSTPGFEARGLPEGDLGWVTNDELYMYITEDGEGNNETTLQKALEWKEKYKCDIIEKNGKPILVECPDWHSHSWLTYKEYEKALKFYSKYNGGCEIPPEYKALLAVMKSLKKDGYDVRTVFWFDS